MKYNELGKCLCLLRGILCKCLNVFVLQKLCQTMGKKGNSQVAFSLCKPVTYGHNFSDAKCQTFWKKILRNFEWKGGWHQLCLQANLWNQYFSFWRVASTFVRMNQSKIWGEVVEEKNSLEFQCVATLYMIHMISQSIVPHAELHLLELTHYPEICQLWSIWDMYRKVHMYGQYRALIMAYDNAVTRVWDSEWGNDLGIFNTPPTPCQKEEIEVSFFFESAEHLKFCSIKVSQKVLKHSVCLLSWGSDKLNY